MFKLAATLSLLPLLALASPQYNLPPPGPATSSAQAAAAAPSAPPSSGNQFNIDVGANGAFVFSPNNITAPVGSLVTFFFPGGATPHSVTQSTFASPCTPLTGNGTGFDSGLQNSKQFTINITDASTPIWFFCKAPTHCGTGMVGSINAPASGTNTFEAFQAAAVKISGSEVTIPDNGPVTGGVGAIATATPAATFSGSGAPSPSAGSGGSGSPSGAGRLVTSGGLGLVAIAVVIGLIA